MKPNLITNMRSDWKMVLLLFSGPILIGIIIAILLPAVLRNQTLTRVPSWVFLIIGCLIIVAFTLLRIIAIMRRRNSKFKD
jgi:flagellar biosynthesis protein FliQ